MKLTKSLLTLTVALIATDAFTQRDQTIWDLNRTYNGNGVETVNSRRNREYSSVNVQLRNNGTAFIRFGGARSSDFTGRWRGPQNNVVTVDVNERDTRGSFRVFLERQEVRRVEGTVVRKDDRIRITFRCEIVDIERPAWNQRKNSRTDRMFETMFGTRGNTSTLDSGGDGTLRSGRSSWDVDRMIVDIQKDGDLSIKVRGDRNETYRGRWQRTSAGRISFTITEAHGDKRASGNGWLTFSRQEVNQLRTNFRAKSQDYSLTFARR